MKICYIIFMIINIISILLCYKNILNYNEIFKKAKICRLTYMDDILKIKKDKLNMYNNYYLINDNKSITLCYIFYNKKNIDIYFRGTSTHINEIFININVFPSQYINNNIYIHSGFLNKYLSIKHKIIDKIDKIIKNNDIKEISFNGHSSGGAIANIASLDLSDKYKNKIIKCYTFGSPNVGNNNFLKEYNKRINISLRIVNKNDIIQYLPPILYDKDVNKKIILIEDKKREKPLKDILLNLYNYIKSNHAISSYIKNLKRLNIK